MNPELDDKEFGEAVALTIEQRYEHFLERTAQWGNVWGLRDEGGWVSFGDDEGNRSFALWPHERYAAACATDDWEGNVPTPIDLKEFLDDWLPHMIEDDALVAVFSTPENQAALVSAAQLDEDLRDQLENRGESELQSER